MNTALSVQLLSPCGIPLSMDAMIREVNYRNGSAVAADSQPSAAWPLPGQALPDEQAAPGAKPALGDRDYSYRNAAFYSS